MGENLPTIGHLGRQVNRGKELVDMEYALEQRRLWLTQENSRTHNKEQTDAELKKIANLFNKINSLENPGADEILEILSAGSHLLGSSTYDKKATILPFRSESK